MDLYIQNILNGSFDLGDNFVIQFDIDTEELTDESVIININIRNFYHGEV